MTVNDLKAKIKASDIGGAYIFAGDEDYLKKYYLAELVRLACPDEGFALFNRASFDGDEVQLATVEEAIKSPPMFGEYKLIEWKYPDLEHMSESEKKALESLSETVSEYPYAVLVLLTSNDGFDPGSIKRPSRLAARLSKFFNLINFEKSTDSQLIVWLKRHFDAEGISTDAKTLSALIFRSGHAMQTLKCEVEKLSAYAKQNSLTSIGEKEIMLVAAPTLECDAFALSSAITERNREMAFVALKDLELRRMDSASALAMLSRAFGELVTVSMLLDEGCGAADIEATLGWNAYKIKICINAARRWGTARLSEAMARLRELDAASKSGGVSGIAPVEIFVTQYL